MPATDWKSKSTGAARSERERVAAKRKLADLTLEEIVRRPLIDPSDDDVTRLILDTFDQEAFRSIRSMTVGEFREFLLDDATTDAQLKSLQQAIIPEIAAAVTKLMSNKDLVLASANIRNVTRCRNTMGEPGVLGIRVQPNHPADDIGGILLAAFEGLLYGCGDAVIGVNPATDSVETVSAILAALNRLVDAYEIPTQICCLAHVTTQLSALNRGAPVDLLFQSVAGTEAANRSFGITLNMLREGREYLPLWDSENNRRGQPRKLFEYLLFGLPVVASDVENIARIVRQRDVGLVVSSPDPAAHAESLARLLGDASLHASYAEKAVAAAKTFSFETQLPNLVRLYERILSSEDQSVKRWDDPRRLRAVDGERSALQDHSAANDDGMPVAERELRAGMR